MPEKRPPTLRDVALSAGVSPYTVSVVLNGSRSNTRVSEGTRRRIQESAAALHYHPNAVARSLARRYTNTIGVLFALDSSATLANPYASSVLLGISRRAAAGGYDILLYTEQWHGADRSAPRFRDRRSDGVIVIAPGLGTDVLAGLASLDLPLVAVAAAPEQTPEGVGCTDVDNALGIQLAVDHLTGFGHRRIAHIMGDADVASVAQRQKAFTDATTLAGCIVSPLYLVAAHYNAHGVAEAFDSLMSLPEPPTAIVAGNDNIAIVLMEVARARGVAIPNQLSVIGFDDVPAAAQVTPKLTTIHQPLSTIGEAAADLLIARINHEKRDLTVLLFPPELVVRESTSTVRSAP
ncbi:MAG: LacI family DNA-binding transcriptional regulator [Cytophagales bacterium]|nr:LacI family DNA-binding transcriptional regulator [Armatimonadota bacterium]